MVKNTHDSRYSDRAGHPARYLFGYAISHRPDELYEAIGSPLPSRLSERAVRYICHRYVRSDRFQEEALTDTNRDLLRHGLTDTHDILLEFLRERTETDARAFARNPGTIQAIALLALRPEDEMKTIINPAGSFRKNVIAASRDETHLDVHTLTPSAEKGCPFAGQTGVIDVDPLFASFVGWTADLSIASLSHHGLLADD